MSRRYAAILALSFASLAIGCNRSASEPPPNALGTSVAATLSVQPAPTRTALPTSPTTVPEPTATSTATASPEPEITESPAPTGTTLALEPDDPRLGLDLAAPDFTDDFSQRGTWFEYPADFEDATIRWEDGRMRTSDSQTDGFLWWSASSITAADFYAEVEVELGDCSGRDAFGLAYRVDTSSFDQGYTLEISCDGYFRLRRFISESVPLTILNWTIGDAILTGPNSTNQIGVLAEGSSMHAFANGQRLTTLAVQDSAYSSGALGLFSNASDTPGLTAYFGNFKLWYISP